MALIYGQLEKAQLEILTGPPASAPIGYIYYDSTLNAARVLTNAGWVDATQPGTAVLQSGGTITGNLTVTGTATLGSASVSGSSALSGLATMSSGFSSQENSSFSTGKGLVTSGGLIAGALINVQIFNGPNNSSSQTTGTYTPTAGTRMIVVEIIGGGGSGGNAAITSSTALAQGDSVRAAGAGGGGAYIRALIKNIRPGGTLATMSYKTGNAGQVQSGSNVSGGAGGASEFLFGSVLLRSLGGSGGIHSSTGNNLYRVANGGSGGQPFSSGSSSDVVVIDYVAGTTGGDTIALFDQQFSQSQFLGLIQNGEGGTPFNTSAAPMQMVLNYTNGVTSIGNSLATQRSYGVGGSGCAVIMQVAAGLGGIGGAGRVVVYEYA